MQLFSAVDSLFARVFGSFSSTVSAPNVQTTVLLSNGDVRRRDLEAVLDHYVDGAFTTMPLLRALGNIGVPDWAEPNPVMLQMDIEEYQRRWNQRSATLQFVTEANDTLPKMMPRVRDEITDAVYKTAQSPFGAVRLHNLALRLNPYTPDAIDSRFGKLSGAIKNAMLMSPDWVAEESRDIGRRIHRRVETIREKVRQNGISGLDSPWQWVELAAYLNMLRWNPLPPAAAVFRKDLEDLQRWVRVPEYMIGGTFEHVPSY